MGSETRYISSWNDGEAMSRMWTRTVITCQKNRWVKLSLLPYFEHENSHIHFKRQYLTPPSPQLDYRGVYILEVYVSPRALLLELFQIFHCALR